MEKKDSIKKEIFERDNFSCQKCGFQDKTAEELEIHNIKPKIFNGTGSKDNLVLLCSVCHRFAPDSVKDFDRYIQEKIDWRILETFRKSNRSIAKKTKEGMLKSFNKGAHITKAPKGYKLIDKCLVPNENSGEIQKAFQEFLDSDISLTQLAKKYNVTPAGIIKLLKNTTYIGKVKFANQETEGQHTPIISQKLFNQVQEKIGKLGWK